MSRQFTKTEQHRLAKKLHDALTNAMNLVISMDPHGEDVLGITFRWSGPKANKPEGPNVAMDTEDRTTVVHGARGKRLVAFSQK